MVKLLREVYDLEVLHLLIIVDAYYVFCACSSEDLAGKFRVTRCHKNELEFMSKAQIHILFEVFLADKVSFTCNIKVLKYE